MGANDRSLCGVAQRVTFGESKAALEGASATKLDARNNADDAYADFQAKDATFNSVALPNSKLSDLSIAINNTLTSTATDIPLSAAQGKVVGDRLTTLEALVTTDEASLATAQQWVDYMEANKASLDALGISAVAGLQAALDAKAALAGADFTGDISTTGDVITSEVKSTGNLKLYATNNDLNIFLGGDEAYKLEKDTGESNSVKSTIYGGNAAHKLKMLHKLEINGVSVDDVLASHNNQAARSATVTKDSTSANIGTATAAGSFVGEVFIDVTEAFTGSCTIDIKAAGTTIKTVATSDLDTAGESAKFVVGKKYASSTQFSYTVNNAGSAGSAEVFFKPWM